jgi:UDP-N-acetylglucosamine:LPS N-acetylglucosamine transferase
MATLKLLAISSGGGHWVQLCRISSAFSDVDVAFASVDKHYAEDVPGRRFYKFRDATRRDRFGFAVLVLQLLFILAKERPHVVITTGAAPALIALALAKYIFRARTLWVDSIANCEQLSTSGLFAGKVADAWLTQWPHLAEKNGPAYWGAVL